MIETVIINLDVFHTEIDKDKLVLFGRRGINGKQYKINIILDRNWKATSIAKACMLRLRIIANEAIKCLNDIKGN